MKIFALSLALTVLCFAATAGQPENQEASFNSMRQTLNRCDIDYKIDSADLRVLYQEKLIQRLGRSTTRISIIEERDLMQQAVTESRARGSQHQKCVENAKSEMNKNARSFIGYFKQGQQQKAKKVLVLWMTALGVTGQENFETELTKFDDGVNALKIDAMIGTR